MAKKRKRSSTRRVRHSLGRGRRPKTTMATRRRANATRQRRARASVRRSRNRRDAYARETARRLAAMHRERFHYGSRAQQKWDEAGWDRYDY